VVVDRVLGLEIGQPVVDAVSGFIGGPSRRLTM
jgi:hypothetical protein